MAVPKLLSAALLVLLSITSYECSPRGRILGGKESLIYSRPYMASLQLDGVHFCGGLLISDEWVLSAAHCKPDSSVNKTLQVVLGAISLSDPEKLVYNIDTQIIHPEYNTTAKHHDLLLLKLPEKVPLSKSVRPLPYQTEDIVIKEKTCLVSGWGKIRRTGKKPDLLNEVWVPVISPEICNSREYYHGEVTENIICAGDNKRDSCEGDSGGPLICNGVAEAIVSSGFSVCGNAKRPGKYTRIYPYKNWIIYTMHNATEPITSIQSVNP